MPEDKKTPEKDPKAWQNYAVLAINSLYPRLRNGEDYAVGRKDEESDIELLAGADAGIDWGKVQEAAQKLADADPYADYQPRPGLAPGQSKGYDQGERHRDPDYDANEKRGLKVEPAPAGAPRVNHPGAPPIPPKDPNAPKEK